MKSDKRLLLFLVLSMLSWSCSSKSTPQISPTTTSELMDDPITSPVVVTTPSENWAQFLDSQQYDVFIGLIEGYFEKHEIVITIGEGYLQLGVEGQSQFGLVNIAQHCAQIPQSEWSEFIYSHFDKILRIVEDNAEFETDIMSFEEVKDLLAVRIWPKEYISQIGPDNLLFREDFENTISVIVLDFPTSVRSVSPEEYESWGVGLEEVFEYALNNTFTNYLQEGFYEELEEGIGLWLYSDGSFFVASQALFLDQYQECLGKFGALYGIPTRDILLCYPIDTIKTIEAIDYLIIIISGMEFEGPGSVSPHLYWYRDGTTINLPYSLTETELHFVPPDEFVDILNQLVDSVD